MGKKRKSRTQQLFKLATEIGDLTPEEVEEVNKILQLWESGLCIGQRSQSLIEQGIEFLKERI